MKKDRDYLRVEECAEILKDVKAQIDPVMAAARKKHGQDLMGFLVAILVEVEPGMAMSRYMITAPKHVARHSLQQMLKEIEQEDGWSHEE